jgi:hypothetical protein
MTTPSADLPDTQPAGEPLVSGATPAVQRSLWVVMLLGTLALLALLSSVFLWQKLSRIQEQLARQSADSGVQALEAKTGPPTTRQSERRQFLAEMSRLNVTRTAKFGKHGTRDHISSI